MNKKYPGNTPVTLDMLLEAATYVGPLVSKIKSMIEPPKLEPKDGEWWMCRNEKDSCDVPLLWKKGQWCSTTRGIEYAVVLHITPLYKMVPEKEAE